MIRFLILSAALITGCPADAGSAQREPVAPAATEEISLLSSEALPRDSVFEPAEGVAVFTPETEALTKAGYAILVFGADGSVLKRIDYRDDSLDSLEGEEGSFFPLDFSNGASREFSLEFRLTGRSKEWLRVIAHETREPPVEGFLRAADPLFKTITWEQWVLAHFNIRFDENANPVRQSPDGPAKYADISKEPLIRPDEVNGDWVRIRWTVHEPDEPSAVDIARKHPENVGWIRWRHGRQILISEFYP